MDSTFYRSKISEIKPPLDWACLEYLAKSTSSLLTWPTINAYIQYNELYIYLTVGFKYMRGWKAKGHHGKLLTTEIVFIGTWHVVWRAAAVDMTFNGTRDCLVFLMLFFLTFHDMPMFSAFCHLSRHLVSLPPDLAISALVCLDIAFCNTCIFHVASSLSRLCTCPNHLNIVKCLSFRPNQCWHKYTVLVLE